MALITLAQAAQYAQNAGFQGNGLATVLAITLRESGLRDANGNFTGVIDTQATNPVSGAAGVLQFNPQAGWPITYDPQAQYQMAYDATGGGVHFGPWTCDVDCGLPAGNGVTPASPQTVIGSNGLPISLPPEFGSVTGYYGQPTSSAPSQIEPVNVTVSAPANTPGDILGAPISFLQNAGVGVLGLVVLLIGGLIIAAPAINENVVQPAVKGAKAGILA